MNYVKFQIKGNVLWDKMQNRLNQTRGKMFLIIEGKTIFLQNMFKSEVDQKQRFRIK